MVFRICFPGTVIFMPAGEQKLPRNCQFYVIQRTRISLMPIGRRKKINLTTFFFAPLGNPDRNSFPEKQKIRKKFPEKLETKLRLQNRFFHVARQMALRKSPTARTFLHRKTRIFYVSLLGNTDGSFYSAKKIRKDFR